MGLPILGGSNMEGLKIEKGRVEFIREETATTVFMGRKKKGRTF